MGGDAGKPIYTQYTPKSLYMIHASYWIKDLNIEFWRTFGAFIYLFALSGGGCHLSVPACGIG